MDSLNKINTYENLVTLCKISYNITNSRIYLFDKFDKSQIELFKFLSNNIIRIETKQHINVLSIISNDSKTLYIVISGTDDIKDITSNIDIIQESANFGIDGIKFHRGFLKQSCSIFDKVLENISEFKKNGGIDIYLTGHSAGGCIVSILSYYLIINSIFDYNTLSVVTFGSPFFINKKGAEWFNHNINYYRIELHGDPIPNIKMFSDYTHISNNHIYIKKNTVFINTKIPKKLSCFKFLKKIFIKKNIAYYHSTSTYLKKLIKIKYIYTD